VSQQADIPAARRRALLAKVISLAALLLLALPAAPNVGDFDVTA
jgi:hypothetical protein